MHPAALSEPQVGWWRKYKFVYQKQRLLATRQNEINSSLFTLFFASAQAKRDRFFADVTIYGEGGKYYLTGSKGEGSGPQGFAFLESTDLKTWAVPAKSNDSLEIILTKGDHTFGTKGFWVPQIFKNKGTYYMTYTADEQTVMA